MTASRAHIVCTGSFRVRAPAGRVFPLVTPEGERAWVPEWSPEWIHPADGTLQEGGVFRTQHGGEETIWMILTCDPQAGHVRYVRDTPGSRIGVVDVVLHESAGVTEVTVTYTLTALSEEGRARLVAFVARYEAMLSEWEEGIGRCAC